MINLYVVIDDPVNMVEFIDSRALLQGMIPQSFCTDVAPSWCCLLTIKT